MIWTINFIIRLEYIINFLFFLNYKLQLYNKEAIRALTLSNGSYSFLNLF